MTETRVEYVAVRQMKTEAGEIGPGEVVEGAADWPNLQHYLNMNFLQRRDLPASEPNEPERQTRARRQPQGASDAHQG